MLTSDSQRPASIEGFRRNAELHVSRTRRANTRAVLAALLASSLSAFLTGLPSALGQPVVGTWRITCAIAAAFAAFAAVTTGLQAQFRFADRLAVATECLGRLRALEVRASLGTLPQDELANELAEIVARYPEYT